MVSRHVMMKKDGGYRGGGGQVGYTRVSDRCKLDHGGTTAWAGDCGRRTLRPSDPEPMRVTFRRTLPQQLPGGRRSCWCSDSLCCTASCGRGCPWGSEFAFPLSE